MIIYFVIYIFLWVSGFVEILTRDKLFSKTLFSIFIAVFFFMSFLRWERGTDWDTYLQMYTWIVQPFESYDNNMEFGFWFINNLGKLVFGSYTGVLFLFAVVLYLFFFFAVKNGSKFLLFSLFIAYSLAFANIFFVRQTIAISICLFSISFIKKEQWLAFALCVFFASLFHRSALIFLIAYPLWFCKLSLVYILVLLVGFVGIGVFIVKPLFLSMSELIGTAFYNRVEGYFVAGSDDVSGAYSTTAVIVKGFLNRAILTGLFLGLLGKERLEQPTLNGLLNLYFVGTALYFILLPMSISMARLAVYFDFVQILIIPMIFEKRRDLGIKIFLYLAISFYLFTRFISLLFSYPDEFIPFKTIFQMY